MIEIYTDGSSRGNPGPGGYGVILKTNKHYKEISEGFRKTTNNRMELLAVIVGLEALKNPNQIVVVYSDSQYVVNSVEKQWVHSWIKKDFKDKKNKDLWIRFMNVYRKHKVKFEWIKGHNGHPLNEKCDKLAVEAALQPVLLKDEEYEREARTILFQEE